MRAITSLEIPELIDEQLEKFSTGSIHAQEVMQFDLAATAQKLQQLEGKRVLGADLGGDQATTQLFEVQSGRLVIQDDYSDYVRANSGDGYLDSLEKTAKYAAKHDLGIGVSWGGPLEGSKPLYHPKFSNLLTELEAIYDGDLANVLPNLKSCLNDAPAGLITGAVEARRKHQASSVLYAINGSGINLSALVNNKILATESGHVEADQKLNVYHQTTPCGVFRATYTCLERIGANKAGIEPQWKAATGEHLRAIDIEGRYKEGNELAGELYDHSALVVAHMITGASKALDVDLSSPRTVIVGHGGAFKFPHYGERVQQILEKTHGGKTPLIMTKDFVDPSTNACIMGAALAALVQRRTRRETT
jgi:predicted NBD/HSP70 family sugar kinase